MNPYKKLKAYLAENHYEEIRNSYGLYLRRWKLFPRNRVFNIYLHQILLSDERVHHDHRYASLSFVLKGRMIESILPSHLRPVIGRHMFPTPDKDRVVKPWRVYYRSSTMLHLLTLFGEKPVWTLFIAVPEVKPWGFMTEQGWVGHEEYLREK